MRDTVREFSEYIQTQIHDYLPETYQEADVYVKEELRNNGIYGTVMELRVPGEHVVCTIHMDPYFAGFGRGNPLVKLWVRLQSRCKKLMKLKN